MIVKEDIEKAVKESFDVAKVTNVIFDEIQKAFGKGFDLGVKITNGAEFSAGRRITDEEMTNVIKILITTLDDTTWNEGHPGYSDSEPGYDCPQCSCEICYRVSCQFNKSELFKKLYKEFPELYENKEEVDE